MTAPVRWGILATGGIARSFADDLRQLPDAEIVAVGSRSPASAEAFAGAMGVPHAHGSYAELVADPDVDVIYVSTPHPLHREATLLAIEHGKAVLCEKPFAMDRAEAQQMVEAARAAGVFLMEAMWTRFLPHVARIREVLAAGTLGELVYLTAEHGQWFPLDATHRLFAPLLGGGALLDLGIYPVSFAHLVFGEPSDITAVSTPTFTGVDATTSMVLRYPTGAHAVLTTSLGAKSNNPAVIYGSEARLEIDGWFYRPTSFRIVSRNEEVLETFSSQVAGRGMEFEAAEVNRCIRAGLTESPLMPLDETVEIMGVLDEIRAQIGLDYAAL
jgi:predicted dehydrogenase